MKIFRYVTENTFDSYMWQILENKQKFISQIMTSKWLREQRAEKATAHWWQVIGTGSAAYQAGGAETERADSATTAGAKP